MPELAFALLAIPFFIAIMDWRKGFTLCVITALLQDPLRKLTPGQPVYFVVFTGVVFAAAWIGALMSRVALSPNSIKGWREQIGTPFGLFVLLVLAQAVHSFVRFFNPIVTGIGLMSYLAAVPAVVLAYQFAIRRGLGGMQKWMWLYIVAALLALSSVYLEYAGVDWRVLGEVGEGVAITNLGADTKGNSGFFRGSEVAAWHVATTACFMSMLFVGKRFTVPRIIVSVALVVFLLSVGILTGRRKMLVEVAIFFSAYLCLVAWFQSGAARLAVGAAVAGAIGFMLIIGLVPPDPGDSLSSVDRTTDSADRYQTYTNRGQTVFEDIPDRFWNLGVKSVADVIEFYGWFGMGLGTGSQGAQHFTSEATSGSAEAGLGKITLELGVPGLALSGWLLIAFGRYVRRLLEVTTRSSQSHARFAYGLVAFLLANVAAFTVATQVYGDLFVLLLIGWTVGFLLAMPALALRAARPSPVPAKGTQRRVMSSPVRPI